MHIEGYTLTSHRRWVTTDGQASFERVAPRQYQVTALSQGQSVLQAAGLSNAICHGTLDEVIEQVVVATDGAIADTIVVENDYQITGEPFVVSYNGSYWTVLPESNCPSELARYMTNHLGWTCFATRRELLQSFVKTMKRYSAHNELLKAQPQASAAEVA